MRELIRIRCELAAMAEKEASKLWRLARHAERKGVSPALVTAIREEGWLCYHLRNNPDRILDWKFPYQTKYAFKLDGNYKEVVQ